MSNFAITPVSIVELAVLSVMFYYVLRVLRGTRGMGMLLSMILTLALLGFAAKICRLHVLETLLMKLMEFAPIFIIVVFQNEFRRLLTMLKLPHAHHHRWDKSKNHEQTELLLEPLLRLSKSHTGALIAIEQQVGLEAWTSSGKSLNAPLRKNFLLETIFYEGSPLHDGGVVIRNLEIASASCTFPLCERDDDENATNGMRHQAAIGLSEQCDAVVIVVSEETGRISIAIDGKLNRLVSDDIKSELRDLLNQNLIPLQTSGNPFMKSLMQVFGAVHWTCSSWGRLFSMKMHQVFKRKGGPDK